MCTLLGVGTGEKNKPDVGHRTASWPTPTVWGRRCGADPAIPEVVAAGVFLGPRTTGRGEGQGAVGQATTLSHDNLMA